MSGWVIFVRPFGRLLELACVLHCTGMDWCESARLGMWVQRGTSGGGVG